MDLQDLILKSIASDAETAEIYIEKDGVLSGIEDAATTARELGLFIEFCRAEGDFLTGGSCVMRLHGTPKQMVMAEDRLIGLLAKPSGIATAAAAFCQAAGDHFRVVCGAIKKVDNAMKKSFRRAIATGGCGIRLVDEPMVYLDKNYIAMFGGIKNALEQINSVPELKGRTVVVQVKGNDGGIALECWTAAEYGADIIFLDTGRMEDFAELKDAQQYMARFPKIAYAGDVKLEDLDRLKDCPVDIVGVGKAIVDAPMIDMRFDITSWKPRVCSHRAFPEQTDES